MTLQDEIEQAKHALYIALNQFDRATGPWVDVAAAKVKSCQEWLNALYQVAKQEEVTV